MMRHLIAGLVLATSACASAAGAPAPGEIAYGIDACDYCHMSIDDSERAAQWVESDGGVRKFDEPGCLIAWLQRNPDAAGTAFVADAAGGGWLPADRAVYLRGGVRTGMGFDVIAYANPADARDRSARAGGDVTDWLSLRMEGVAHAHAD